MTATPEAPPEGEIPLEPTVDTTDANAELEKWKAQARKHEERAKVNAAAAKELETLRAQTMSDTERAVAEAKAAGRAEALAETAGMLVDAQIKIAAAGRLGDDAVAELLDGIDRAKFLTEDGKVDTERVKAFVDRITPAPEPGGLPTVPDLGQGARNTTTTTSDPLLASVQRIAGVRT